MTLKKPAAGDAVQLHTPGESCHGLYGVVDRVSDDGQSVFVLINSYGDVWKFTPHEMLVVPDREDK